MNWENKNVFITGATGLLGSHLTTNFVNMGANVTILNRDIVPKSLLWQTLHNSVNIVQGKLEDYEILERIINEYEITNVFHLGAQTIVGTANRNPMSTFETNIRGSYNLLEACRRNSSLIETVVVASSDKAYGTKDTLPYDETTPLRGVHPYDVSKSCVDLIAHTYYNTYKLPVCITRCGNLYGPGDLNFSRIIPGTIKDILTGNQPVIRSDGTFIRDYFYVKDAALSYQTLAEKMYSNDILGQAFNFSNEIQVSVIQLVNKILKLANSELKPIILGKTNLSEIKDQYLSAEKARTLLDWHPTYTLEQGLNETIMWYRDNI